jgi:hypothetical protein
MGRIKLSVMAQAMPRIAVSLFCSAQPKVKSGELKNNNCKLTQLPRSVQVCGNFHLNLIKLVKFPQTCTETLGNLFEIPTIALSLRLNSFQFSTATVPSCFRKRRGWRLAAPVV